MSVTKPTVGGSTGAWGTILNDALDSLDVRITAAVDSVALQLPKAGGTLTGRLVTKTESMARVTVVPTSGDITFDLSLGNYFTATIAGVSNLIFTNIPTGAVATGWIIKLTNPGAHAFTFAAGAAVKWPGGVTPSFTASGKDTLVFITDDDGTTIRASVLASNQ